MTITQRVTVAFVLVAGLVAPRSAAAQVVAPLPEYDPRWEWGREAKWYGPYSPFQDRTPWFAQSEGDPKTRGALKIKATPSFAEVYIDGLLAGTVKKFDGLFERLKLGAGGHLMTLRAEGFEDFDESIIVVAGKTQTIKAILKKR